MVHKEFYCASCSISYAFFFLVINHSYWSIQYTETHCKIFVKVKMMVYLASV